ncbi:MAG TPA: DEAD/DEAH box helicase, partial [Pirellulales bacterium]
MASAPQREKNLFSTAPWELDDVAQRWTATLVFPGPVEGEFDYTIPERLQGEVEAGRRVKAPFGKGNRLVEGYCVRTQLKPAVGRALKELAAVVDRKSLLSPAMLRLTAWIAERYLCSWGQVLEAVVPAGVRGEAGTRIAKFFTISPNAEAILEAEAQRLAQAKADSPHNASGKAKSKASQAVSDAYAAEAGGESVASDAGASEVVDDPASKAAGFKLTPKQTRVLQFLARSPEPLTAQHLAKVASCGLGPIHALVDKGLIVSEKRRTAPAAPDASVHMREDNLVMNSAQAAALQSVHDALNGARHETILLHGVTGSGKTEVYIQAIQEVVRYGRQSIVLVPEISLTPQTVQRFRSRFDGVAVLHSHLTDSERHFHWEKISRGAVQVVVGARSAIFAPTPNLGLIVLDEEHETTFK